MYLKAYLQYQRPKSQLVEVNKFQFFLQLTCFQHFNPFILPKFTKIGLKFCNKASCFRNKFY